MVGWFDPDSRSRIQELISKVEVGWENIPVLSVCLEGLLMLNTARLLGYMACPGSFLSGHGQNHPNPKSGQDLDSDKPRCTMSCRGDETDPKFSHTFFWMSVPNPLLLQPTESLRIGFRFGSGGAPPLNQNLLSLLNKYTHWQMM